MLHPRSLAGFVREPRYRNLNLIPTNGVHITPTQYPEGFQAARYDAAGLCSQPRWFPTYDQAKAYAAKL